MSLVWLLGHAAFTFITGGFDPGSPIANVFMAVDMLVIAAVLAVSLRRGKH